MPESLYTAVIAESICDKLQEGKGLREICRELDISEGTVRTWVRDDREGFATQYARAREIGYDVEFEALDELAAEEPPTVKGFVDAGWVAWKRNQIDAKKWSLSKKVPKKYGDKLDLNHGGSVGVQLVNSIPRPKDE